jgi:hypothetical protein
VSRVVRLLETSSDTPERSLDVLEIGQLGDLREIADVGLTLVEAKQLLSRAQQAVIAVPAQDHAGRRPTCSSSGGETVPNLRWNSPLVRGLVDSKTFVATYRFCSTPMLGTVSSASSRTC